MEHHACPNLESLFPILDTFLQMYKEHLTTISGYWRSNRGVNPLEPTLVFALVVVFKASPISESFIIK